MQEFCLFNWLIEVSDEVAEKNRQLFIENLNFEYVSNPEELISMADRAMYMVKQKGNPVPSPFCRLPDAFNLGVKGFIRKPFLPEEVRKFFMKS